MQCGKGLRVRSDGNVLVETFQTRMARHIADKTHRLALAFHKLLSMQRCTSTTKVTLHNLWTDVLLRNDTSFAGKLNEAKASHWESQRHRKSCSSILTNVHLQWRDAVKKCSLCCHLLPLRGYCTHGFCEAASWRSKVSGAYSSTTETM